MGFDIESDFGTFWQISNFVSLSLEHNNPNRIYSLSSFCVSLELETALETYQIFFLTVG